jgi:hypothetical protein
VNTSDIICTIKTNEEKNICAEYIIRQSHYNTCMCPELSVLKQRVQKQPVHMCVF